MKFKINAARRLKATEVKAAKRIKEKSARFAVEIVYEDLFGQSLARNHDLNIETYVDGASFYAVDKVKAKYQALWKKGIEKHVKNGQFEDSQGASTWRVGLEEGEHGIRLDIRESHGRSTISYNDSDYED